MNPNSTATVFQPQKRSNTLIKIIFLIVTLLAVIIVLTVLLKPKSPTYVSDNFVKYVLADDATDSYDITSPAFQESTSFKDWTSNVQTTFEDCSGTITLSQKTLTASTAVVGVGVTNRYGVCNMQVRLVKDGRNWRVNYFSPT